jgi:hypothetical protein
MAVEKFNHPVVSIYFNFWISSVLTYFLVPFSWMYWLHYWMLKKLVKLMLKHMFDLDILFTFIIKIPDFKDTFYRS